MAIKPTIYKANVNLSDIDRHRYQELNLTMALHPSETPERMLVRLVAYCLNVQENLVFTKGISTSDEPDIWAVSLDDRIEHWIEIGQPDPERVKKAVGRSEKVSVYLFGKSAGTWWQLNQQAFSKLNRTSVFQFQWNQVEQLMAMLDRTMKLNVTINEGVLFISDDSTSVEFSISTLLEPK